MNVVDIAADKINKNTFFQSVLPDVLKYFQPDFIAQKRLAIFG